MPNWCNNNLDITAKTAEHIQLLNRIVNRAKDQGVFEIIRPLPEALKDTVKGAGEELQAVIVDDCNNWYDWQIAHWGTKWDIAPDYEEAVGDTLSMSFDSAWRPPVEIYEYLVELGFEVSANYYEPGMAFAGEWINGDDFVIKDVFELARQEPDTLSTRERDLLEHFDIWNDVASMDAYDE